MKECKCTDCGVKLASNKQRCQLCNESLLEFLEKFDIVFELEQERLCNQERGA
jgi:hypothetical protein